MYMLSDLNEDELDQIINKKPQSDAVIKVLSEYEGVKDFKNRYDISFVTRDEAFGELMTRVVSKQEKLSESCYNLLLDSEFPTARQILGAAVVSNKLNHRQCLKIYERFSADEWVWEQAKAYIILEFIAHLQIDNDNTKNSNNEEAIGLFFELCSIRAIWAVVRALVYFDMNTLEILINKIMENKLLSRHDRHVVSEKIKHINKKRG